MTPRRGPHCLGGPAGLLRRHDARDASRRGRVDGDRSPHRAAPRAHGPAGLARGNPRRVRPAGPVCRRARDRQDPAGPGVRGSGARLRRDCGVGPLRRDRGGPGLLAVAPGPAIARRSTHGRCSPRDVESPEDRFRRVRRRGRGTAGRGRARPALVVVLDDVHRADAPSLLVLRHLADRVDDAPSARPGDVPRRRAREPAAPSCCPSCCARLRPSASTCAASASPTSASSWQPTTGGVANAPLVLEVTAGTRCSSARWPGRSPTGCGGRTGPPRSVRDDRHGPARSRVARTVVVWCRPRPSSAATSRSGSSQRRSTSRRCSSCRRSTRPSRWGLVEDGARRAATGSSTH